MTLVLKADTAQKKCLIISTAFETHLGKTLNKKKLYDAMKMPSLLPTTSATISASPVIQTTRGKHVQNIRNERPKI